MGLLAVLLLMVNREGVLEEEVTRDGKTMCNVG